MDKRILESASVRNLVTLIEEEKRAKEEAVKRFVEPAEDTLRRAISKRHQMVFGRRGSGKTSLLLKAAAELTVDRRPIAYVNLEPFKGHSYPDVLLSVLIRTFETFKEWLETAAIHPANKKSFWHGFFGTLPTRPAFNKKAAKKLAATLTQTIEKLENQLNASDNAELSKRQTLEESASRSSGIGTKIGKKETNVGAQISATKEAVKINEIQELYRRSKIDFLLRNIINYQKIFKEMHTLSGGDSYLILDDLYHIKRANHDQVNVLDFFHRIAKDNHLWLKVGTIRYRTEWYLHGDPPLGLKLGDDADQIELDLSLDKFNLTKKFLIRVLNGLIKDCGEIRVDEILTEGALKRLVLASGGVARDFLGILTRSIKCARERLASGTIRRGPRVSAEDVNNAAGEYHTEKEEEFKRDTLDDLAALRQAFDAIVAFCKNKAQANCFLLDKDTSESRKVIVKELVDLRLLHPVKDRVTISGQKGQVFEAYMLDVSQYAGVRKIYNLEEIRFWESTQKEKLRRKSIIFTLPT